MAIESNCPGCGRKLSVADEHAGQKARCPACGTIYQVGGGSEAPRPPRSAWRMRTPEGQIYGPVDQPELDAWVSEGRVSADCELSSDTVSWQQADRFYPVLRESHAPTRQPTRQPTTTFGDAAPGPRQPAAATVATNPRYRYTAPHRGGLVLTLGILSWAVGCPIFGVIAWVMGSTDLREMRLGRMDPSGQGLTQAGQIIGMIHAILLLVVLVLVFGALLVSVAAR